MEVNSQDSSLSCKEIFALLSEYLDAELPPELCDSVAAHIQGCDPCVEFLQSLQKTITLCRQYQPHVIPPPLAEQVRRDLRHAYENFLSTRKLSD
jgi:anti-sigma factor RsiW